MPDALPPVGVPLASLDAAALPLAGTELTFVMQGGQPRKTPVSSIGGGGASANTYSYSGTYEPTIEGGTEPASGSVLLGGLGISRVGNGAGEPSAGDTVTVFGLVLLSDVTDGDVFTFPLPFSAGSTPFHTSVTTGPSTDLAPAGTFVDADTFVLVIGVPGADTGVVSILITYQTANAVDP